MSRGSHLTRLQDHRRPSSLSMAQPSGSRARPGPRTGSRDDCSDDTYGDGLSGRHTTISREWGTSGKGAVAGLDLSVV